MGGKQKTFTGSVKFNGVGLENVEITDKVNVYATTDLNGNFSFSTTKESITIYPQKSGYIFTPAKIVLTEQANIEITCTKAESLNGKLVLDKVLIKPTSIVSFSDNNFLFVNNNQKCLKIEQLDLTINENTQIINKFNGFAPLNDYTDILGDNAFELEVVDGKTNLKIEYTLNTYFTINSHQSTALETARIVRINKTLDTGNLIDNQFELYVSGVNSSHGGYSYNLSFVFEYIANEGV